MEIEVVGHHRRPQDSDGDIEHGGIGDDPGLRHEARHHIGDDGLGDGDLEEEARRDQPDQRDDEGLELAEAVTLQQEDDEDVQRRHADSQQHRHAEQKVERDGGADDLRQVAGADGDLAEDPKPEDHRGRIAVAAGLGQVAAGGDAETGAESLQQHGHQIRQQHDRQQGIAEGGAAGQIRRPIAGIHIADGDDEAGPGKGQSLAPGTAMARNRDRVVDLGKARAARCRPPSGRTDQIIHPINDSHQEISVPGPERNRPWLKPFPHRLVHLHGQFVGVARRGLERDRHCLDDSCGKLPIRPAPRSHRHDRDRRRDGP